MDASLARPAVRAATAAARVLGLSAEEAVVLHASNRTAVRLLPCDVLVRVTPAARRADMEFEVESTRRLTELGSPVARLDPRAEPRVHLAEGFATSFWTYFEGAANRDVEPAEYAAALRELHGGLREIGLERPHFSERAVAVLRIVDDRALSPELPEADRDLLSTLLRESAAAVAAHRAREQLLHGEPHPGNVLATEDGLLFTDFESSRIGPIEFDIAWYARVGPHSWDNDAGHPGAVAAHYPGADPDLVRACWMMVIAVIAAHRWDRNDRFPDRQEMRTEWLGLVRAAVERYGFDARG